MRCGSWDITKLRTTKRGVYYELYVIIDIYSRYVVGWTVVGPRPANSRKHSYRIPIDDTASRRDSSALHADLRHLE